MEQSVSTIDSVARIVSFTGLGVAILVGVIHLLTYFRGRWQNPRISIHMPQGDPLLISEPHLLVAKFFVDNPSTLPNTIIGISCKARRNWFKSSSLNVGNIELTFVDVETSGGKWISDLRLAIAPDVTLDEPHWKILLEPRGTLLRDGLWKLPLQLSGRSSQPIIVAIASQEQSIDGNPMIVFRDITNKRHSCSVKLGRVP